MQKFLEFDLQIPPSAVAVKRIEGRTETRLKALALNQVELDFCRNALMAIRGLMPDAQLMADALWCAVITRFFKCFGHNKSRAHISPEKMLQGHAGADAVYNYFKSLRDKHFVHDENSFSEAIVALIVNEPAQENRVADVVSFTFTAFVVDDAHMLQMTQLVDIAATWTQSEWNRLKEQLRADYERRSLKDLMALPDVQYIVPGADAVATPRKNYAGL